MKCPYCGFDNRDSATFCEMCEMPLNIVEKKRSTAKHTTTQISNMKQINQKDKSGISSFGGNGFAIGVISVLACVAFVFLFGKTGLNDLLSDYLSRSVPNKYQDTSISEKENENATAIVQNDYLGEYCGTDVLEQPFTVEVGATVPITERSPAQKTLELQEDTVYLLDLVNGTTGSVVNCLGSNIVYTSGESGSYTFYHSSNPDVYYGYVPHDWENHEIQGDELIAAIWVAGNTSISANLTADMTKAELDSAAWNTPNVQNVYIETYFNQLLEETICSYRIETGNAYITYEWYLDSGNGVEFPASSVAISPKRSNTTVQPETSNNVSMEGYVIESSGGLKIRSGPATSYEEVGRLAPLEKVIILEIQSDGNRDWGRIERGWVCMEYIQDSVPNSNKNQSSTEVDGYVMLGSGGLNIRNGPGVSYKQIGRLAEGEHVVILETQWSENKEWGRINSGWVCMEYIQSEALGNAPSEETHNYSDKATTNHTFDNLSGAELFNRLTEIEYRCSDMIASNVINRPSRFCDGEIYRFTGEVVNFNENRFLLKITDALDNNIILCDSDEMVSLGEKVCVYGVGKGTGTYTRTNAYGRQTEFHTLLIEEYFLIHQKEGINLGNHIPEYAADLIYNDYDKIDIRSTIFELGQDIQIRQNTINGRPYVVERVAITFIHTGIDEELGHKLRLQVVVSTTDRKGKDANINFYFGIDGWKNMYLAAGGQTGFETAQFWQSGNS